MCSTTCGSRSRTRRGWARWPAAWPSELGGEPGSDRAEHGDLLRWLADGNFLFLGYREYDLVQTAGRHRPARRARHRPRHPAPRPAGPRVGAARCRPRSRAGRRTRPSGWCWPRRTPGPPSTGPATWTTSRSRSSDPSGDGHRGVPVPRAVHARGAHRAHRRRARAPPQAGPGPGRGRGVPGQPRRQGPGRDPGGLPARGAVRDLGRGAHPDRARRAAAERAQADQAVPAPGPVRAVHVLPGLPAQGPVHHQGQAARAGHPARGAARGLGGLQRHGRRLGPGPAVRGGQGRAGHVRCRGWTRPRWSASWPRRSGRGTRISPPRRSACSARSGPAQAARAGRRAIPETYKADVLRPRTRSTTCLTMLGAARVGEGVRGRGWSSTRSGGRWWCTGPAPRSPCPTCCPSSSTWGSRSSTSTRTVQGELARPARSGSTSSACGPRPAAASGSLQQVFEDALTALWQRRGRGRRVQRPGADGRPDLARGDPAARLRQVPAPGRACASARTTCSGCCAPTRPSPGC